MISSGIDLDRVIFKPPLLPRNRLHCRAELVAIYQTAAIFLSLLDSDFGVFGFLHDSCFLILMQLLAFADHPSLDACLFVRESQIVH